MEQYTRIEAGRAGVAREQLSRPDVRQRIRDFADDWMRRVEGAERELLAAVWRESRPAESDIAALYGAGGKVWLIRAGDNLELDRVLLECDRLYRELNAEVSQTLR